MSGVNLSRGSVKSIYGMNPVSRPVLQVHEVRKLQPSAAQQAQAAASGDRYRVVLSDGEFLLHCVLMAQLNHFVVSGELDKGSIVTLVDYQPNRVQDRVVAIIINLEVVERGARLIGNPVTFDPKTSAGNGSNPQQKSDLPMESAKKRPALPAVPEQKPSVPEAPAGFGGSSAFSSVGASPSGPVVRDDHISGASIQPLTPPGGYTKISAANPYQNNVVIRGRVVQKGELRTYSNAKGEGKLFSFEIADETGTMRVTAFREKAIEAHQRIELNGIYSIAGASLKPANAQFNHTGHSFEMILDQNSVITQLPDDNMLQRVSFDFVKIRDLADVPVGKLVDLIGVAVETGEVREINSRTTGMPIPKRDIKLIDDTGCGVALTVWGERARLLDTGDSDHPILLVKAAKRGDFNGVSLSTTPASHVEVNPNIREAFELRGWFDSEGQGAQFQDLSTTPLGGQRTDSRVRSSERKTFAQVQSEHVGEDPHAAPGASYYTVRATISHIKQDDERPPWYLSCPDCKKKVMEESLEMFRCERCDKIVDPVPRYIFSIQAIDATGSHWLNCYDEVGPIIFGGYSAAELKRVKETEPEQYQKILEESRYGEYVFRVRVRSGTYQDEMQYRHMVVSAEKTDYESELSLIQAEITRYEQGGQRLTQPLQEAITALH
jgi:replication factor A1